MAITLSHSRSVPPGGGWLRRPGSKHLPKATGHSRTGCCRALDTGGENALYYQHGIRGPCAGTNLLPFFSLAFRGGSRVCGGYRIASRQFSQVPARCGRHLSSHEKRLTWPERLDTLLLLLA